MTDLETRIAKLEDIEAIRRLKHLYGDLCDNGYDAEALAALFTEDGVWDAGEGNDVGTSSQLHGRHVGRAAIRRFFSQVGESVRWSMHTVLNELIDVRGDKASGKWLGIIPSTFIIDGRDRPYWTFAIYRDSFRREGGEWKFTEVRGQIQRLAPHEAGWN